MVKWSMSEKHLMKHAPPHEQIISATPQDIHLLNVRLRNLLDHGMALPLKVHVPPLILACIVAFI